MFFIVYLSIYLCIHILFYLRISILFSEKGLIQWFVVLFLGLMIIAPISSYLLERNGYDLSSRFVAVTGFYWMGFIFYAFLACLAMVAFDFCSWCIHTLTRLTPPMLDGKIPAYMIIGLAAAISLYGSFEARNITIERLRIETPKLPEGIDSLKIVQISDVHMGLIIREEFLKILIDKIESESPDILVGTGDLADRSLHNLTHLTEYFKRLRPPYGKYAVLGNHENYAGIDVSMRFLNASGFTILRGEGKTIKQLINIAGVDDSRNRESMQDLRALSSVQNGLFTIFLKHRPHFNASTLGLFDLQLSGHTHNGQLFPFNFLVKLEHQLMSGYHDLGKGSKIYINRGTGTWGPPMRVLSSPEITVVELVRKP